MGGLASSATVKFYMQAFKQTAISAALHPPKVWERFVDDVYSILKRTHLESFFHHVDNLHQNVSNGGRKKGKTIISWHFIEM